jgi:DNA invertase Pin-like site-specific DNA recombinase
MLDILAAVGRKDYEDRRRRVAQGQAKAKAEGRYRCRPEDSAKNARIARMLNAGLSWSQIQETLECSRRTVAKVAARMRQEEAAA